MYINQPATFTDYYELTMAQGYYKSGLHNHTAVFDYFFRALPFDGGYVVYAGLNELLETVVNFRFQQEELEYLEKEGFDPDFISYLKTFRFQGDLFSAREGDIIFPKEPVLRVEGNLVETQIIETLILNILNFQSLIATKASRLRFAAGNRKVLDFGLRRSQGLGGVHATRAALIGGLDGTSNVYAAKKYNLPASGTMAHSWVQSFEDELTSFRTYAREFPDHTILLVDTYNTLESGVPNAIKVAKELESNGHRLAGIRLDSGDLAYFAKQSRKMLDEEGLDYVKIAASNQLDEHIIKSLISQNAPIDVFGVGTRLVTGQDSPALDGVYKLAETNGKPSLKISENIEKITFPGRKKVFRYLNEDGSFNGDAIVMEDEEEIDLMIHPYFPAKKSTMKHMTFEPLLHPVIRDGEICLELPGVMEIADFCRQRLQKLNREHQRFDNPHIYKVGISKKLSDLRDELITKIKEE
jgi:nicotinate phosphoribosyltransferase